MNDTTPPPRHSRRLRILRRLLWAIPLTLLLWHLGYRLTSTGRAARVVRLPQVEPHATGFRGVLRLGVYNIAHGKGQGGSFGPAHRSREAQRQHLLRLARLLRRHRLDVLVLNEVDFAANWSFGLNQASALARRLGLPYVMEGRNFDVLLPFVRYQFGNAVLSRFPLSQAREIPLPPYSRWEQWLAFQKRGFAVRVHLTPARSFLLLPVHLEYRSETIRVRSVRRLLKFQQQANAPVVLAGDFNASPSGYPHTETTSQGHTAVGLVQQHPAFATAPQIRPTPAYFTYPSHAPDRVIDWIFAPPTWKFVSFRVLVSPLSDHNALLAVLQLPPSP